MKTIKDIVNTLSPEEQEHFSDLINECQQREQDVFSSIKSAEKAFETLEDISNSISKNLELIDKAFRELSEQKLLMEEKMLENQLKRIPEELFFHA